MSDKQVDVLAVMDDCIWSLREVRVHVIGLNSARTAVAELIEKGAAIKQAALSSVGLLPDAEATTLVNAAADFAIALAAVKGKTK
jgi:hypothetical protein